MASESPRHGIQDEPAYGSREAAHILSLPPATVRAWCFGHDYPDRAGGKRKVFDRVVDVADPAGKLLSFTNLCELHLLSVIRRRHGVRLSQVRAAVDFMRERLGERRPLASAAFRTNGVDLFVEHAGRWLNVSKQGQQTLREEFERALQRVDFAASGSPVRLFPYSRAPAGAAEQPKTIVVDPSLSFGRPVIVGAGVRTEVVESRFQAGDSIGEMAQDYGVDIAEIEEALRFEQRKVA